MFIAVSISCRARFVFRDYLLRGDPNIESKV